MHGSKVFNKLSASVPVAYKLVSMFLASTGGGLLVPIFINSIPVALSTDAYPIAIVTSFLLHQYLPILREILRLSPVFKGIVVFMYECMRAFVVVKFTSAAGKAIAPSDFSFPVFGPIICGGIAGCGGLFLPLDRGLDAIRDGLQPPMVTALIGATVYHLFISTSLSEGVKDAHYKAQLVVATFFVVTGMVQTFEIDLLSLVGLKKKDGKKKKE
jgi:hypothetical protein